MTGQRTWWRAKTLNQNYGGSLLAALFKYRQSEDRQPSSPGEGNLISSVAVSGLQMPILDLDSPHLYLPSSTPGHGHLYLNVEIPRWRWAVLMWGLYVGRAIELGYFVWSLRRGANFVREPGAVKVR